MKLKAVNIRGFRSIADGTVSNCGGFNVLIGKNNAGKSNILTAINAFFNCIQNSDVVTLSPPIGTQVDFHYKEVSNGIKITLGLSLNMAERDIIVNAIVTEAPQMRNAVEGMDPALWLYATIVINQSPARFSYVSKLSLDFPSEDVSDRQTNSERLILSIGHEAAIEIRNKRADLQLKTKDAEELEKLIKQADSDFWRRVSVLRKDSESRGSSLLRRYFNVDLSNDVTIKVESMISEANSPDDLVSSMTSLIEILKQSISERLGEALRNQIETFAGEQATIPGYATSVIQSIAKIKVLYLKERREPIGKKEASQLLTLKIRRGGTEILRSIQETIDTLLGVKIDAFQSSVAPRIGEPTAEIDIDNFLVEVNGAGIREALRIVLDMEFENPDILLVEEPEIHLHPALETGTMRYLKSISSKCQVFITTHSTNFLDTAEMQNVYLISKNRSTKIRQVDLEGAEAQIPEELGIRLSSLFMYDRLVFVEGPSDEAILREWASILKFNFGQANVGFIHMGGARNFAHYASEATLNFLTRRRVKMWFIIDRDERDDSDVQRLKHLLGETVKLKVLTRREIENYLIVPHALKEFIESKRRMLGITNGELPTESEIIKTIDICADGQKYLAIYKRIHRLICKPIFPLNEQLASMSDENMIRTAITSKLEGMVNQLEQAKENFEQHCHEQTELITTEWASNKLAIVLGDILLDTVCKEYGIRFKKDRDGAYIASLMEEGEIDNEVKVIIREIVS